MDNKVTPGDTIPFTNTSGSTIPSGRLVATGHTLGVAVADIPNNTEGTLWIRGRYRAPKVSAAVFAPGEKLVWDVSANGGLGAFDDSAATPAAGDLTGAAVAARAGANAEAECEIVLTPGNVTKT